MNMTVRNHKSSGFKNNIYKLITHGLDIKVHNTTGIIC
jgi:hypothetical protein